MPKIINGKKLTAKEERQWKEVYEKTGKGAIATDAVKKSRRKRKGNR